MFIDINIFSPLVKLIVNTPLEPDEYKSVARIFELCACHPLGIAVLAIHLQKVVQMLDIFMQTKNDLVSIKYPAATVLLDLTANEQCIDKVAKLVKDMDLFKVIIVELENSLNRKVSKSNANRVYFNRFRDLMIGIVLNLTCNVEIDEIT
jgi:hypothetical protein